MRWMSWRSILCLLALVAAISLIRYWVFKMDDFGRGSEKELRGVLVEVVDTGAAFARADVRPGDLLLRWERLPSPPENPEGDDGEIITAFDFLWVEVEQAPRGPIRLFGERMGEPIAIDIFEEYWGTRVRPRIPGHLFGGYLKGRMYFNSAEFEHSAVIWNRLANIARDDGSWRIHCWLLLQSGDAWWEAGQWDRAYGAYEEAFREARDNHSKITALDASGFSYEWREKYHEAELTYRSMLEIREQQDPDSLAVARSYHQLGIIANKSGRLDLSESYLEKSLDIRNRHAPKSLSVVTSLSTLGFVAGLRTHLTKARNYYEAALAICQDVMPDSQATAVILHNLGSTARRLGNFSKAEEYYSKAAALESHLIPGSPDIATTFESLGLVALDRGAVDLAHAYYKKAYDILKETKSSSSDMANILGNLGAAARAAGDVELAEEYYRLSLATYEEMGSRNLGMATTLSNLATGRSDRGDRKGAVKLYEQALAIETEIASESLDVAMTLNNLGSVAIDIGNWNEAENYFGEALRLQKRIAPAGLDVSLTLYNQGLMWIRRGRGQEAILPLEEALAIRRRLAPGSVEEAEVLQAIGLLYRMGGDYVRATSYFESTFATLERQVDKLGGSPRSSELFRTQYRNWYEIAVNNYLTSNDRDGALQVEERMRGQSFLALMAERAIRLEEEISEELAAERRRISILYDEVTRDLSRLDAGADEDEVEELHRKHRNLRREWDDNERERYRTSPRLKNLRRPDLLAIEGLQEALDPGTVALEYHIGADESYLFVLSREQDLKVYDLNIRREEVEREAERLLRLIAESRNLSEVSRSRRAHFERIGRRLFDALVAPASCDVDQGDRILIIPDGPLHYMPFGSLVRKVSEEGSVEYFVECRPLHLALSMNVYAQIKHQRRQRFVKAERRNTLTWAGFGDPDYSRDLATMPEEDLSTAGLRAAARRNLFEWKALPESRREIEEIAALFGKGRAHAFLGDDATEGRVKAIGSDVDILHFAVHGYADDALAVNSSLILSLPDHDSVVRDNGLLQVWEIFEDLRLDAELVVLSACRSAHGQGYRGEGLNSLTRAFQYAGTRSVVASLWDVDDASTADLMVKFYRHFLAGESKDEALRAAQIEMIHESRSQDGSDVPYHWAAFQLYGDWQ